MEILTLSLCETRNANACEALSRQQCGGSVAGASTWPAKKKHVEAGTREFQLNFIGKKREPFPKFPMFSKGLLF